MNESELRDLLTQHVKLKSGRASIIRLILCEFQARAESQPVAIDQIVHKIIERNNECLSFRQDAGLVEENEFLKTLLPSYLSVAELREHLKPLGLDNTGASVGKAVKYLRSNGLSFLPADVKKAVEN